MYERPVPLVEEALLELLMSADAAIVLLTAKASAPTSIRHRTRTLVFVTLEIALGIES